MVVTICGEGAAYLLPFIEMSVPEVIEFYSSQPLTGASSDMGHHS